MIGYTTALFALIAATLVIAGHDELVQCTPGIFQIIGKADCTGFFMCVFGKKVEMPPCPQRSVFSSSANVCVPKGSMYDDCKKTTEGSGGHMPVLPDLVSVTHMGFPGSSSNTLLNVPTHSCSTLRPNSVTILKMYNVEAGQSSRMDVSQYRSNQCPVAHCRPCSVDLPSCVGKPDGINVHPVKLWSPFYAVCYKERTIKEERCQADENGRTQLFHPEKNECVSLDMIPREHGGMMPECGTKVDGFYQDEFGRCDRYVRCQGGKYIGTVKCAIGELRNFFHTFRKRIWIRHVKDSQVLL
ncbi:hypothetical protein MAR_012803 [Mya arenaria]|uniref:Chitin-binding type-2 domain-containing protein n=1 Tax=Mya arenaria TaxID=6604 RepID=A0ABY7G137_MYAAR|nr:hypothetical protein MAR_012803 [Mya arenaria]